MGIVTLLTVKDLKNGFFNMLFPSLQELGSLLSELR